MAAKKKRDSVDEDIALPIKARKLEFVQHTIVGPKGCWHMATTDTHPPRLEKSLETPEVFDKLSKKKCETFKFSFHLQLPVPNS